MAVAVVLGIGGLSEGMASATASPWNVVKSANVEIANGSIDSVSCPGPDACEAVGSSVGVPGADVALAEVWNGTTWKTQKTPTPAGAIASSLEAVSCTTAASCEASSALQSAVLSAGAVGKGVTLGPISEHPGAADRFPHIHLLGGSGIRNHQHRRVRKDAR
jgi:hypothetical protein